jgi:hypothetical protein
MEWLPITGISEEGILPSDPSSVALQAMDIIILIAGNHFTTWEE